MLFKYPEILYFLFLLIIPVIVHLFQLRKFKKVSFTNVVLLQNLVIKNRKSSQLKKWLTLCTRLFLLSALVFAFAQPFFSDTAIENKNHIAIYLDNSLSTDTKGNRGNSLKIASQEIIENILPEYTYSLITNSGIHQNISGEELKKVVLTVENSVKKLSLNSLFLQLSNLKNITENIFISDFQNIKEEKLRKTKLPTSLIQILPEKKDNLSVDSVYTTDNSNSKNIINVLIKNQGVSKENIPIAVYNDEKLISKQIFSVEANAEQTVIFSLEKTDSFLGRVKINYNDTFIFDNHFFFTLNTNEKINVSAIGISSDFLSGIYTDDEFKFSQSSIQNVNYNSISQQHLIILNEIESIPQSLISNLVEFSKNGGCLMIVPSAKANLNSYNSLFRNLSIGRILNPKKDSLKITQINFRHPLFQNVFDKKVRNFQYPDVYLRYPAKLSKASTLISFENNSSFIQQVTLPNSKVFWIASPLSRDNSNFKNSPLIVPVFYNIGQQSLRLSKLYYILAEPNIIELATPLEKDDILTIKNNHFSFIPLQQTYQTKVKLTTNDLPDQKGFYTITKGDTIIESIAFNNPKEESSLQYLNLQNANFTDKNIHILNSIAESFKKINDKNKVHWLWKWFLLTAIVSLLLEILILKYFKG